MNGAWIAPAAAMLIATLIAPYAHARVDAKCYNEWNAALITQQIGQKCNYADAAEAARLQAAQATRMQCALKKATAAEQADVSTTATHAQADSVRRVAQTPCSADTRKVFDTNVSRFAH
jgi:hypothetical protein